MYNYMIYKYIYKYRVWVYKKIAFYLAIFHKIYFSLQM